MRVYAGKSIGGKIDSSGKKYFTQNYVWGGGGEMLHLGGKNVKQNVP